MKSSKGEENKWDEDSEEDLDNGDASDGTEIRSVVHWVYRKAFDKFIDHHSR